MSADEGLFVQSEDGNHCCGWSQNQLTYIGKDCQRIPSVLVKHYGNYALRLDLSFNCLRTLEGLDHFSQVEELILDNNCLEDGTIFYRNPNLIGLSLNKNRFRDLARLIDSIRFAYPNLRYLSLLGNDACPDQLSNSDRDDDDYKRYRYYVIHALPVLSFLDSSKVRPSERREATRIGEFMCVIRPNVHTLIAGTGSNGADETVEEADMAADYDTFGSHTGAYGKLRYKYTGKHSEGNRFIRNQDL